MLWTWLSIFLVRGGCRQLVIFRSPCRTNTELFVSLADVLLELHVGCLCGTLFDHMGSTFVADNNAYNAFRGPTHCRYVEGQLEKLFLL